MREKEFYKSVINNRNSVVHIWYLVASCTCEVTAKPGADQATRSN